jgi:hypothetical protein
MLIVGLVISSIMALSRPANAQTPGVASRPSAVDLDRLEGLCDDVSESFTADPGTPYKYRYEQKIIGAAGLNKNDFDEASASGTRPNASGVTKIQRLWSYDWAQEPKRRRLKCETFDVLSGSILKYALKMGNYLFFARAVQVWRVPVNYVDESDGRTVLDYVEKEIDRTDGTETSETLRVYHRMLLKAGAKRRAELPN